MKSLARDGDRDAGAWAPPPRAAAPRRCPCPGRGSHDRRRSDSSGLRAGHLRPTRGHDRSPHPGLRWGCGRDRRPSQRPRRSRRPDRHRPPLRRPGRRHAGLVPRGGADHLGVRRAVDRAVPGLGPWRYAVSLAFALLLYLSVLLHELSHTFLALRSGLPVRRISLHVLGGVSEIERPAETPGRRPGSRWPARWSPCCWRPWPSWSPSCSSRRRSPGCSRGHSCSATCWWASSTCCPACRWTAAGVVSAVVWRATGRPAHGHGRRRAGPGAACLMALLGVPFLVGAGAPRRRCRWSTWPLGGAARRLPLGRARSQAILQGGVQRRLPGWSSPARLTRRAIPVRPTCRWPRRCAGRTRPAPAGLVVVDAPGTGRSRLERAVAPSRATVGRGSPVGDLAGGSSPDADAAGRPRRRGLLSAMTAHPASSTSWSRPTATSTGVLATARRRAGCSPRRRRRPPDSS